MKLYASYVLGISFNSHNCLLWDLFSLIYFHYRYLQSNRFPIANHLQIQNSPVFTYNLGLAKVNLQRQKGARSLLAPGEGEDIFTPPQQSEIYQMPK